MINPSTTWKCGLDTRLEVASWPKSAVKEVRRWLDDGDGPIESGPSARSTTSAAGGVATADVVVVSALHGVGILESIQASQEPSSSHPRLMGTTPRPMFRCQTHRGPVPSWRTCGV